MRRYEWMDWLRGVMVLLMIQGHLLDSWLSPGAKESGYYALVVDLNGIPSRAFLFLVGLAVMIRIERTNAAAGVFSRLLPPLRRGLALLGIAYLFRLQQLAMRGFRDWDLGRVDILNCLAATMMLTALVMAPLPRRARPWTALVLAGTFFALGPVVGTTRVSDRLPEWLTAYIGGARPLAWFPLFPWAGWGFLGAAIGSLWLRLSMSEGSARRFFGVSLLGGILLLPVGLAIDRLGLWPYRSKIESDMGIARIVYYLGMLAVMTGVAGLAGSGRHQTSSLLIRLGRASLLIYWVHLELCYGRLSYPLHDHLSLGQGLLALVLMIAAMLALALLASRSRQRRSLVAEGPRAVAASPGPIPTTTRSQA
jgi:uncharacterized membrane protein